MNTDKLLQAIGGAKNEYLAQCEQSSTSRKSRVLRIALVAAAVLVLCAATVAASVSIISNIKTRPLGEGDYQLYFEQNPASDDAPERIEEYYLPTYQGHGLPLINTDVNGGLYFAVAWSSENGSVNFSQRPLYALDYGNAFYSSGGVRLDELQQNSLTLDGVEYVKFTRTSEYGDAVWYYWIDEAHHYVFSLFCSEHIAPSKHAELLRSVRPISTDELMTFANPSGSKLWLPEIDTTQYFDSSWNLYADPFSTSSYFSWQDDLGLYIGFEQRPMDLYELPEGATKIISGVAVHIAEETDEFGTTETWTFAAADGKSELVLTFMVAPEREAFSDGEKEAIFRSIRPIADLQSLIEG